MKFFIVTGMSGAGKTTVLKFLEDLGFFCVDNLPPTLLGKFAEICLGAETDIQQVALGIDIRGGKLFDELFNQLAAGGGDYEYKIIFLDANNDVLLNRYKESRRNHPLAKTGRLVDGIEQEREILANVMERANHVVDTSYLLTRQLRGQITKIILGEEGQDVLVITLLSFGFKYGIPEDSDLVWDVRFIPNPFYIEGLKMQTGLDPDVRDYVLGHGVSREFLSRSVEMLDFLIPHYIAEGKNQLVISIGCTGGRHRSVALATELSAILEQKNRIVQVSHRDIEKDV